jgi:hypothetical protein
MDSYWQMPIRYVMSFEKELMLLFLPLCIEEACDRRLWSSGKYGAGRKIDISLCEHDH